MPPALLHCLDLHPPWFLLMLSFSGPPSSLLWSHDRHKVWFSQFGRRSVELDVVQGRPVPWPVLLHDPLAEGVEPVPGVEPSRDRPEIEHHQEGATIKIELLSSLKQALWDCVPIQSIVDTIVVSSIKAEPVWLKASSPGPFLVIVHVKDSVVEPWGTQERSVRSWAHFILVYAECREFDGNGE